MPTNDPKKAAAKQKPVRIKNAGALLKKQMRNAEGAEKLPNASEREKERKKHLKAADRAIKASRRRR